MILGPDGKPARPLRGFETPALIKRAALDYITSQLGYVYSRPRVVLTDADGRILEEDEPDMRVGDTVRLRTPSSYVRDSQAGISLRMIREWDIVEDLGSRAMTREEFECACQNTPEPPAEEGDR